MRASGLLDLEQELLCGPPSGNEMSGILERLDAGSLARCLSSCRLLKIVGIDAVEVRTPVRYYCPLHGLEAVI